MAGRYIVRAPGVNTCINIGNSLTIGRDRDLEAHVGSHNSHGEMRNVII